MLPEPLAGQLLAGGSLDLAGGVTANSTALASVLSAWPWTASTYVLRSAINLVEAAWSSHLAKGIGVEGQVWESRQVTMGTWTTYNNTCEGILLSSPK